jgi:uncharacterized protein YjcR
MYIRRKLSDEQILDIKEKYKSGLYREIDLAIEYGVSIMTISLWLQDDPYSIIKRKRLPRESVIDEIYVEVGRLKREGLDSLRIAQKLGLPLIRINKVYFKV